MKSHTYDVVSFRIEKYSLTWYVSKYEVKFHSDYF